MACWAAFTSRALSSRNRHLFELCKIISLVVSDMHPVTCTM